MQEATCVLIDFRREPFQSILPSRQVLGKKFLVRMGTCRFLSTQVIVGVGLS
jgi:hypothetical protein